MLPAPDSPGRPCGAPPEPHPPVVPSARLRRVYDGLLTGVPFGVFKVAAGWALFHLASWLGCLVALWGALDIALNLLAVAFPRRLSWCLLSNLGRHLSESWEDRLLALDTFLSFGIVALMIAAHQLAGLPPALAHAWDAAVIGNVMGAGLDRLYRSWG